MIEFEELQTRGPKTKMFLLFTYGWMLFLIGIIICVVIWQINFGALHSYALASLEYFKEYYVDISMLSQWLAILAVGFFVVGYLRGNIMFRNYKFLLDDHAFHLRRGIFMVKEVTIPYHQISNVHIIRPYHYRFMGLAQVDIATASDKRIHHSKVKDCLIPVIDYSIARVLSKQLISFADRVKSGEEIEEYNDDDEDTDEFEDDELEKELDRNIRG